MSIDPAALPDDVDALKRMINLFAVSCRIVGARLQFLDIAPNIRHFCAQRPKVLRCFFAEFLELVLRRYVLNDVSEHLPNFFERRFLFPHKQ